ncbi:hypothetical protein pipiens_000465, partial [Culex pipiens pipiens]
AGTLCERNSWLARLVTSVRNNTASDYLNVVIG